METLNIVSVTVAKKSSQKLNHSVTLELDQRNEYSPFGACVETGTN